MKKSILMTVCLSVIILTAYSQDVPKAAVTAVKDTSYWKKASSFGVNFNQGSFSDSWQGGAVNNFAVGVTLASKAAYEKERITWVNDFQFQYGMLKNTGQVAQKSLDRIFFDSKYGYKFKTTSKWSFVANLNFLSQVANGYDSKQAKRPLISTFFTPAYLTEALGFEYKPNKHFNLFLSPLALRQTILGNKLVYQQNADNPTFTNWGVTKGDAMLGEFGIAMVVANYDKDIMPNVNLKARYQGFFSTRIKDVSDIDHNLNVLLSAKVNQYLNVGLGAIATFDKDQINALQYAQSLTVGLLYKW